MAEKQGLERAKSTVAKIEVAEEVKNLQNVQSREEGFPAAYRENVDDEDREKGGTKMERNGRNTKNRKKRTPSPIF